MMDNTTKLNLTKTLQKEFLRRNLIYYFSSKGYDNFLVKPYPPSLSDIPQVLPFLSNIAEINHYLEDINIENNIIKIGWNVFILGNKRAFLGFTSHKSMNDIENSVNDIKSYPNGKLTIKELIEWIVETVGNTDKLKDLYDNYNLQDNSLTGMNSFKHHKPVPDFKRRV